MELLPKDLEEKIPKLYETQNIPSNDKIVYVKYFTPDTNRTWYGVEYSKEDKLFFGYVKGLYPEWGYFSLIELSEIKSPLGLTVERDIHFKPTKFKDIKELNE
ncbi:hypothetical protein CSA08_04355 [Candidatus Gracilibacteria bacterium]|nr:MAG: hypothetical protein CSA08_04355 [Candidatus Gracilibacteria bacterium]